MRVFNPFLLLFLCTFTISASAGIFTQRKQVQTKYSGCNGTNIEAMAKLALKKFNRSNGVLFGVKTWTPATAYKGQPGYNSCARVVTAILRKAGCRVSITSDVNNLAAQLERLGFKRVKIPQGGDVLIWNANFISNFFVEAKYEATNNPGKKVAFRHTGIATNFARTIDNKSGKSRPGGGWTVRAQYSFPFVYRPPAK